MHTPWRPLRERRLQTAAARAGYTQACLGLLRDACNAFDTAMCTEHIPAATRRRIINRVLDGDTPEPAPSEPAEDPFVTIDLVTHAAYITLDQTQMVARTVAAAPWCNVDYDHDGRPIGVELLGIKI